MEQSKSPQEQKAIFLFGAGASVDAGVPDTYSFVSEFESYIKHSHPELEQVLSAIINLREKYNSDKEKKKQVDVEQLLDTLRRLIEREKEPLLYFYELNKFLLEPNDDAFVELEKKLQNYIRKRVIVEDEDKLDYLKELFKFDKPLEIYSTNYDTCIEQLCYSNHRLYTDGFDINWNEKNFDEFRDVKHFKLHGSVIWYQNLNTKECVKIPVDAFREEEPLDLRLIYGERVKSLIIYPAQKAEYTEPLTDLQLKFKHRLLNGTKFVIAVGYSFRDDYIVHMLWDAARANDDLKLIIINPNAQELFNDKLRYSDEAKKTESRIDGRTICLPYPFSPIIYQLKNDYVRTINAIYNYEKQNIDAENRGEIVQWEHVLRLCIDGEFISKAEWVLEEKIRKKWDETTIGSPQNSLSLIYSFKALLHSAICKDEYEDRWLTRLNEAFKTFTVKNLNLRNLGVPQYLFFNDGERTYEISDIMDKWIRPILNEKERVLQLLTPKFEDSLIVLSNSFSKLDNFGNYLKEVAKGTDWRNYAENETDSQEIKNAKRRVKPFPIQIDGEIQKLVRLIETDRLRKIFGGDNLEFKLQ
jgi:NAD-dependent SIR2 family protein deacetylase